MQPRVSMVKLTLALALGLAVVAGGWQAVRAFNPQPEPPAVWYGGAVTLPPGDYMQVNVSYGADPTWFRHPPDPGRVMVQFFDGTGRLLQETVEDVPVGETRVFRHVADLIIGGEDSPPPDDDLRGIVRARVRVLNRTLGGMSAVVEVGSQETRSSRFAAPGEWVGFNPQPEPPAIGKPIR